jgi:hypothetical protein
MLTGINIQSQLTERLLTNLVRVPNVRVEDMIELRVRGGINFNFMSELISGSHNGASDGVLHLSQ